jgi:hypothetical protein
LHYEFAGSSFKEEQREDAKRVAMIETIRERITATRARFRALGDPTRKVVEGVTA